MSLCVCVRGCVCVWWFVVVVTLYRVLSLQLQTLNLFDLSQHFSQTGPLWLKEPDNRYQTPQLTPAPPPSACGYYNTTPMPTQHNASAVLAEEDDSELDYGGLGGGTSGKVGEKVHYSKTHPLYTAK